MAKSEEASFIVALRSDEITLLDLGIFELLGKGHEDQATRDPLYNRLAQAENVLRDRREIAAAEARLVDPKAPAAYTLARGDKSTVEIRLRLSEITRLVRGLEAFLARPNPTVDPFTHRLVHPPEMVRPLRDRLAAALAAGELAAGLAAREQALRS